MSANVGSIDRILRVVIGLALLSLVFVGPQTRGGKTHSTGWGRMFFRRTRPLP